ncbi:MAG TPA: sialidase family protein [Opitutaceae bacterium]|nr:sialidase family protein [Opitutaceae bacterium]
MIRRLVFWLGAILTTAVSAAEKSLPPILSDEIASPAAPGAVGAALFAAPDGIVWLTWVEPGATAQPQPMAEHHHGAEAAPVDAPPNTLRFSAFDAAAKKWRAARTVAVGHGVPASSADFPQLVVDARGRATIVWADGHGRAFLSTSADRGATWSAPAPVTRESNEVEKFSLAVLADGRVLAAWLDARAKKSGPPTGADAAQAAGNAEQLYARVVGDPGPDTLVDPSVCDCCQTTLTAFPDGTALLAYRGRTTEEVRDIRVARFRAGAWDEPRTLNHDDWRINACPINGPRLASDGGRVAAAWFTAADNEPRVLASFSPDAGARFLMPLRIDRGQPAGHVDTLILHDGALLVTWTENDGSVWLRRITPDFSADEPVALTPAGTVSTRVVPRLALVRDYVGGHTPAEFVAAFATERGLRTLRVSVPEGELLDAEKTCDCTPSAEQRQGYPLRGTIVAAQPASESVRVKIFELPGVFAAGPREFKVARETLATLPANRAFLGRVERRDGEWWLFDVRLLVEAK